MTRKFKSDTKRILKISDWLEKDTLGYIILEETKKGRLGIVVEMRAVNFEIDTRGAYKYKREER